MHFFGLILASLIASSKRGLYCIVLPGSKPQDAAHRGIYGVLWTGETYDERTNLTQAQEIWKVNSTITSRIQEVHLLWGHLLAELVEVSYG